MIGIPLPTIMSRTYFSRVRVLRRSYVRKALVDEGREVLALLRELRSSLGPRLGGLNRQLRGRLERRPAVLAREAPHERVDALVGGEPPGRHVGQREGADCQHVRDDNQPTRYVVRAPLVGAR